MTAGEILDRVDALRPNAYSPEQKLRWLRRLDGQILLELLETHRGTGAGETDCHGQSADWPRNDTEEGCGCPCHREPVTESLVWRSVPSALPDSYDLQTELLAPFPWGEGVYIAGLFCQIDLHNGEIQKYNQSLSLLASAWRSLADWINRSAMPKGAKAWRM